MKKHLHRISFQVMLFFSLALIVAALPGFFGWSYTSNKLVDPAIDTMLGEQSGLVVRSLGIPLTTGNMEVFEQQLTLMPGEIIHKVELIDALDGKIHYDSVSGKLQATEGDSVAQTLAQEKRLDHVIHDGDSYIEYVGIPIVSSCLRCHDGIVANSHKGHVGEVAAYFKIYADYSVVNAISASESRYLMVAAGAIVATLLAVMFFIRMALTRPTRLLHQSLEEIVSGEGDLTRRLPESDSELGEISALLNQLMQKIADILVPIKNMTADLHQTSQGLAQTASEAETVIETLNQSADGNAHAAAQLSTAVESVADTNNHIASHSQQTRQMASDGLEQVNGVVGRMNAVHNQTDAFTSKMEELDRSSGEISKITRTIDEIAFQTNLLALNAAVEAARAGGSAGKGFAVVAEEVRNLASRSAKAAEEIVGMIESVQTNTRSAMEQSQHNADQIEKGAADVNEIGSLMEEIVGSIVGVSDQIDNVASTTEEQSAAATEVAGYASSVKTSAAELRSTSVAVAESATEIDRRIKDLETLLNRFRT